MISSWYMVVLLGKKFLRRANLGTNVTGQRADRSDQGFRVRVSDGERSPTTAG
jgi:hypothetical protein